MTRIAFVGAGSVEFTRNLLGDLVQIRAFGDGGAVRLHKGRH